MLSFLVLSILCQLFEFGETTFLTALDSEDRCETMMRRIVSQDRETVTDDTASRLHSTWLSQQCEIVVGPEYVIRKYSFFENGTFLLLRHHYAEESCSIATYTVVARGSIKILSPSAAVAGATEASVRLDSVRLIPFNRQIGQKFRRRMKAFCDGDDPGETKWRPYVAQLIYERQQVDRSSNERSLDSNSHQSRLSRPRNRDALDCLGFLGIEFNELQLIRVEKRRLSALARNSSSTRGGDSTDSNSRTERVELLFGGVGRNVRSEKEQKPNRLQSAALLRADTVLGCPICGSVFRSTEYSPPLFHQAAPLPAAVGGLWLSSRCESVEGGLWSRRFFRLYSGEDSRWSARWTYYADSTCSRLAYTVNAAGRYVQRASASVQRRKREKMGSLPLLDRVRSGCRHVPGASASSRVGGMIPRRSRRSNDSSKTFQRTVDDDRDTRYVKSAPATLPSGTTELELRVTESLSLPVRKIASTRCEAATKGPKHLRANLILASFLSKDFVPRTVEAPATLTFKARIGVDWNGDYTLLLASRKDDLWEAPLHRCSAQATTLRNLVPAGDTRETLETRSPSPRATGQYVRFDQPEHYWWFSSSVASRSSLSSSFLLGHLTVALLFSLG